MEKKIIVIGGGAAGLMAAGVAAERGLQVVIIEHNKRLARKVLITGKGRCNVTNNTDINGLIAAVAHGGKFLHSAFNSFNAASTMEFFERLSVPLKTERGSRVFPCSDKSVDIVDALVNFSKKTGCSVVQARANKILMLHGAVKGVELSDGEILQADGVILATGGVSYPLTGSTGDGFKMAQDLGHTVINPQASLVPLVIREKWCAHAQGLSLKNVKLQLFEQGKEKAVYNEFGEMIFTHFGVSGPLVISASAHMEEEKSYIACIDLKPALDHETLDRRILRDFENSINRNFDNSLDDLLPRKLIPIIVTLSGISPKAKVNTITKEQRKKLCDDIKCLKMTVLGKRPVEEAIITRGGVMTSEIKPSTMESKLVSGLHFAGEVIDVDAYTGGFNLQIAFSTGHLAGSSILKEQ